MLAAEAAFDSLSLSPTQAQNTQYISKVRLSAFMSRSASHSAAQKWHTQYKFWEMKFSAAAATETAGVNC
jgi:hypothetical protein